MTATNVNFSTPAGAQHPSRHRFRVAVWLGSILLLGLVGWYLSVNLGSWKDRFVARKFRTVDAGKMYASGQINQRLIHGILADHQVKVIVSMLGDDTSDPDVQAELRASNDLGIERFHYPLSGDGTGDIHQYAAAVAKMVECENAGKVVLVHCSSGLQRSGGAVFFYRVFVQHWSTADAMKELAAPGKVDPALPPYLKAHMREMAELLLQNGVIDRVPDPLPEIQP